MLRACALAEKSRWRLRGHAAQSRAGMSCARKRHARTLVAHATAANAANAANALARGVFARACVCGALSRARRCVFARASAAFLAEDSAEDSAEDD